MLKMELPVIFSLLFFGMSGFADEVHLTNGNMLEGMVTSETEEYLTLEIAGVGTTKFYQSEIRQVVKKAQGQALKSEVKERVTPKNGNHTPTSTTNQKHKNLKHRFYVFHPPTWSIQEADKGVVLKKSELGTQQATIQIDVLPELVGGTLESLMDQHARNLKKSKSKFRVVDRGETKLAGRPAVYLIYQSGEQKYKEYFYYDREIRTFDVRYKARLADFDTFLEEAEAIIKTLRS